MNRLTESLNQGMRYLTLILLLTWSCTSPSPPSLRHYLFLGHPYDWQDTARVDPRVVQLLSDDYDQLWLGGDVCSRTAYPATVEYLDGLLGLGEPTTHFVFGNHDWDYGDPERIMAHTGRPSFYADWVDGICLLVLNTNLFWFYPGTPPAADCERKESQLDLIRRVCDTVSAASHLVILHHHGLLRDRREAAAGHPEDVFNVDALTAVVTCDAKEQFSTLVYPWLERVQERGVQVILVGGDLGMRAKTYARRMPEGIWVLGSGINNSVAREWAPDYVTTFAPDSVLIFEHDPERRMLNWKFVDLEEKIGKR